MNVKILTALLTAAIVLPNTAMAKEGIHKEKAQEYKKQQQAENKAFRESLKNLPEDQREAAAIAHHNSQFDERLTGRATAHEQKIAKLQAKLAANTTLTDVQKQEILAKAGKEYQDHVAQAKARHSENMNVAQSIHNDPNLTPEQKRAKMKEFLASNKAEHQASVMEKKEKREKFRELKKQK